MMTIMIIKVVATLINNDTNKIQSDNNKKLVKRIRVGQVIWLASNSTQNTGWGPAWFGKGESGLVNQVWGPCVFVCVLFVFVL